jgi:hypothetical protein
MKRTGETSSATKAAENPVMGKSGEQTRRETVAVAECLSIRATITPLSELEARFFLGKLKPDKINLPKA